MFPKTFTEMSDRAPGEVSASLPANKLLDAFPSTVRQRLQGRLRRVQAQEVVYDSSAHAFDVYFPHGNTVVSLVRNTDEGPQLEVGMIGSEGLALLDVLLAGKSGNDMTAVAQAAGEITCVSASRLRAEFSTDVQTRTLISSYTAMFLEQVSQTAVCNGVHTIAQRLVKWLLALRERTGSNDLVVSHESLSRMLGTQRPAVTLAIGMLTNAALISHSRRSIHLRDVAALRGRACGCFDLMLNGLTRFRSQLENRRT
jgi:CRP-like cAMP-binding protein